MKQSYILTIHLLVALFLGYLSFSIVSGKKIPRGVGYSIGVLAVGVVVAHLYFYIRKKKLTTEYSGVTRQHGLNFDPNNPEYKPIGGVGGLGWLN